MNKVLCICPNPSIDVTIPLNGLTVGGLNRTDKTVKTYSGKAVNVAKGTVRLGMQATLCGFMFDANGQEFCTNVEKHNVAVDAVWCKGEVRTNYKLAESSGRLTEINSKGDQVDEKAQAELLNKISDISGGYDVTVISGSLPKGAADSFYGDMVKAAKSKHIICDTEGDKLLSAIKAGAALVKPNIHELSQIAGKTLKTQTDILFAAKGLINLGAKIVLVSLGVDGALITDGKSHYCADAPKVKALSTVGAGDSMLSACAIALSQNKPLPEILLSAVAAGTAAVMSEGTNLFSAEDFEGLLQRIKTERVM